MINIKKLIKKNKLDKIKKRLSEDYGDGIKQFRRISVKVKDYNG